MSTTSYLGSSTLGSTVIGRFVEPGEQAPPEVEANGARWRLITDPLFDVALVTENGAPAAQEAFAARLANILHLNVGNLVVTEGAVVNELVAQKIAVAVARVIELDADRITSGQIDTARLNATTIAAAVATVIELDADRITTGTLDAGRLNAQEVAAAVGSFIAIEAGQIISGKIATSLLNAQEIASAVATIIELNADRITTGTLDADRIAAHSITVGKLLVDGDLAAEIVNAMTVATKQLVVTDEAILNRATIINGLAADVVSAATIYASQLVVTALDENGDLTPGSVNTVQIVDGAVRAAQIHAEEVAGAVARFLTIEVGQLAAGTADIDTLVAQKIAGATADFQEAFIQNLRTNGATIDEAVIGELAANIITSGFFRTAETGQRLEIDSNGLIMYGVDVDGGEYEMVRIGPSGENLFTVGATTISSASVQSPTGSFDQLSVGGQSVDELLAGLPRGMVAWGQLTASSQTDGDTSDYARRGELQTALQPGRLYRIRLSEHFVEVSGSTNTNVVEELRYSFDGAPIYHGLTLAPDNYQGVFARHPVFAGSATTVSGMEFMLDTSNWSVGHGFWLMWMIRPEVAGRAVRVLATSFYSPVMSVEDMGPSMPSTLKRWNDGDGGGTVDPEPTIVRRTTTWAHGGVGGDMKNGTVYQGTYNPYGNRWGGWIFPAAMRTALSGSTIEKIEVYLENAHWYYGSGGTAVIYPNDGSYKGVLGSGTTSANWPRYAGRWVTLPSAWHASIVNGTYKGVSTYTTNTGLTFYGQFKGAPTKFRATYRK